MVLLGSLPLRQGASGESVADLQRRLCALGHAIGLDAPGRFGPGTEAAVKQFQAARGLRIDGICGDETWSSLVDAGLVLGDRLLYERAPMLRGDDVAQLQRLLGTIGFDAGRVDGFLGPTTARAVVEFQRNVGLPIDGVCGPDTVEALRRVAGRTGGSTVARVRETERILRSTPGIAGRRVAVGDAGEATVITDAIGRVLRAAGARVTVVHHPDDSERATSANEVGAEVVVDLAVRLEAGIRAAFYARDDFESVGGRRLAEMVVQASDAAGLGGPGGCEPVRGMRLPVLRETRMPAVRVEVGPPDHAVEHAAGLVEAVAAALTRWSTEPLD
ncbi:MAG TPA: peptidoglycan-binding protein [Acidimicrobiales bacterium]|nr:peptidoglycan-binding protein [Acidimicrobiales bacterium]